MLAAPIFKLFPRIQLCVVYLFSKLRWSGLVSKRTKSVPDHHHPGKCTTPRKHRALFQIMWIFYWIPYSNTRARCSTLLSDCLCARVVKKKSKKKWEWVQPLLCIHTYFSWPYFLCGSHKDSRADTEHFFTFTKFSQRPILPTPHTHGKIYTNGINWEKKSR